MFGDSVGKERERMAISQAAHAAPSYSPILYTSYFIIFFPFTMFMPRCIFCSFWPAIL